MLSPLFAEEPDLQIDFSDAAELSEHFHVFGGDDLPTWSDQPGVGGVPGRINVNATGTRTLWTKVAFPLPAVTSGYIQSVYFRTDPAPAIETDPIRLEWTGGTADGSLVLLGVPSVGLSLHTVAGENIYHLRLNRRLADNNSLNIVSTQSFQLQADKVYKLRGRLLYTDSESATYSIEAVLYDCGEDGSAEEIEVLRWIQSISNPDLDMNGFLRGQLRAVAQTDGGLQWFDNYRMYGITAGPPPPAPLSIDDWRTLHFSAEELNDPEQEISLWGDLAVPPDGGNVPVLIHYFLGTDPRGGLPASATPELSRTHDTIIVRYHRSRSAISAEGWIEWSNDLVTWHTEGLTETVVAWHELHETVEAAMPEGDEQRLFFRLRVRRTDAPLPGTLSAEPVYRFASEHEEHLFIGEVLPTADRLLFTTTENIRPGHGDGENFAIWEKTDGQAPVRQYDNLLGTQNPGMVTLLEHSNGELHALYVDRQDPGQPKVNLIVLRDGVAVNLFHFDHTDGNVLNPVMTEMPDGRIFILIPDRDPGHPVVRRFVVDLDPVQDHRLPDMPMPSYGARIWGMHQEGNRLIVPIGLVERLVIAVIDYSDFSYQLHTVDSFPSKSSEPPRNIAIFPLENPAQIVLGYLRPAPFSDRHGVEGPATGLLGSLVLHTVDAVTFESVALETIAGFHAERAATHNFAYAQIGPRDILLAHTEVDRIHQRHLTGEYANYVGGFLSAWRLDAQGLATQRAQTEIEPNWFGRFVKDVNGQWLFIYNVAEPGDALKIDRVDFEDPGL